MPLTIKSPQNGSYRKKLQALNTVCWKVIMEEILLTYILSAMLLLLYQAININIIYLKCLFQRNSTGLW